MPRSHSWKRTAVMNDRVHTFCGDPDAAHNPSALRDMAAVVCGEDDIEVQLLAAARYDRDFGGDDRAVGCEMTRLSWSSRAFGEDPDYCARFILSCDLLRSSPRTMH
jgi:hypothetical protein